MSFSGAFGSFIYLFILYKPCGTLFILPIYALGCLLAIVFVPMNFPFYLSKKKKKPRLCVLDPRLQLSLTEEFVCS